VLLRVCDEGGQFRKDWFGCDEAMHEGYVYGSERSYTLNVDASLRCCTQAGEHC
jgi:hypothetical protein